MQPPGPHREHTWERIYSDRGTARSTTPATAAEGAAVYLSLGHHTFENRAITATERAIAPYKLLATVGSWGDTLTDAEVLDHLKIWNATGDIKLDPIPPVTRRANAVGTISRSWLSLTFASATVCHCMFLG